MAFRDIGVVEGDASMTVTADRLRSIAAAYTDAWNSGRPDAVAAFFNPEGSITINGGEPWVGREGVMAMAAGFFADVPDMRLICDGVRTAGGRAIYLWTFTGTHAASKRPLEVTGWEEWDFDDAGLVARSFGNFDVEDYSRQAGA